MSPFAPFRSRLAAAACAALLLAASDHNAIAAEFFAGGYSFSDDLGGFRLISVTGSGTPGDPVVLVEEIDEAAPVTLIIRRHQRLDDPQRPFYAPLVLEKTVVNRSVRVWAGFEVELQEVLREPSNYGDGLSFNQYGAQAPDVTSDTFIHNERLYEPYDRIQFSNGHVDPDETAGFRMIITDPTPRREFYLVQDPKLLSASIPQADRFAGLD